jgi:hypothetical protein
MFVKLVVSMGIIASSLLWSMDEAPEEGAKAASGRNIDQELLDYERYAQQAVEEIEELARNACEGAANGLQCRQKAETLIWELLVTAKRAASGGPSNPVYKRGFVIFGNGTRTVGFTSEFLSKEDALRELANAHFPANEKRRFVQTIHDLWTCTSYPSGLLICQRQDAYSRCHQVWDGKKYKQFLDTQRQCNQSYDRE